ncbi:MAG TPA: hypothetical protein VFM18_10000, partial [Methanosarcina sp.]|nr:hypothetical protein [Methanosarcina sp.]
DNVYLHFLSQLINRPFSIIHLLLNIILLNRNRWAATVAPVDHADHAKIGVFDQTFFEKVCDKAFSQKACGIKKKDGTAF